MKINLDKPLIYLSMLKLALFFVLICSQTADLVRELTL